MGGPLKVVDAPRDNYEVLQNKVILHVPDLDNTGGEGGGDPLVVRGEASDSRVSKSYGCDLSRACMRMSLSAVAYLLFSKRLFCGFCNSENIKRDT